MIPDAASQEAGLPWISRRHRRCQRFNLSRHPGHLDLMRRSNKHISGCNPAIPNLEDTLATASIELQCLGASPVDDRAVGGDRMLSVENFLLERVQGSDLLVDLDAKPWRFR